ncbi:MAG: tRNA (adenosine(37)-N6)-threonylcarbamoyltransferase complex dimerization subunit type 1 TsaB [Chloroflexota bacterium]
MMLLAIDTATRLLSLAVRDEFSLLAEQTWQAPNNHTEMLAPAIDGILHHAGITVDELTALAVITGPGSYTGVRIGVSMAKGLAAAQNLPLVGITTLDALAAGQPRYDGTLIAVVRAGRGRVIAGRYRWNYTQWVPRGEPRLLKWAELYDTLDGRVTLAGEIDAQGRTAYDAATNENLQVEFAPVAHSLRRAGFAADLAWAQLQGAAPADFPAVAVTPVYMNTIARAGE